MFRSMKKVAVALAALAALALGGSALATAASSSTTPSATQGTAPSGSAAPTTQPPGPAHGTAAHESAEKTVTGEAAAKAQTAAVRYAGSGTAGPVTSDCTGQGYETTVTKADGGKVEVRLDSSFAVVGRPQGPHGPGGGPPPPGAMG